MENATTTQTGSEMLNADSPEVLRFIAACPWVKTAKARRKYIALDLDFCGVFLVDRVSGRVYSIKAYGVPGRIVGQLEDVTRAYEAATARGVDLGYPGYVGSDARLAAATEAQTDRGEQGTLRQQRAPLTVAETRCAAVSMTNGIKILTNGNVRHDELIADMLSALKECLRQLAGIDAPPPTARVLPAIEAARAAIFKAEG